MVSVPVQCPHCQSTEVINECITKWGLKEKQMLNFDVLARLLSDEQLGVSASDLSVSHLAAWH
jgi:hypothetical protein